VSEKARDALGRMERVLVAIAKRQGITPWFAPPRGPDGASDLPVRRARAPALPVVEHVYEHEHRPCGPEHEKHKSPASYC